MRYEPSYEPSSMLERLMLNRRAWLALGVVVGAGLGAVAGYYLPLIWWYFANSLSDTGGGPHGVYPVAWFAPFGAILGACAGGVFTTSRAAERLHRNRIAAAEWALTSSVVWSSRANRTVDGIARGGKLVLTSDRLLFLPNRFENPHDALSIELRSVRSIAKEPRGGGFLSGGIRERLRVTAGQADIHLFVVNHLESVIARLRKAVDTTRATGPV